MDTTALCMLLVAAGSGGLIMGLRTNVRIIHELPQTSRGQWRALLTMILGFIGGYAAYFNYLWDHNADLIALIISAVFAGGGGFVWLITHLSQSTLCDVRQLHHLEFETKRIRAVQQRLVAILDNAAEGIVTFDHNGVIDSVNAAAEELFGYAEHELVGQELSILIPPSSHERRDDYVEHLMRHEILRCIGREGEITGRHRDGTRFPLAFKVSSMHIDGRKLYTGLAADISERKAMVENLKRMAENDGLTGLHNRSYFQEHLERVIQHARRNSVIRCALMYIDLDNFKFINDTLGHAAGDRVLIEVADILKQRARKSDVLARFGGDEFTILLMDVSAEQAGNVAESFREQLAGYVFRNRGRQVDVGCSIGVAALDPSTESAERLMSEADAACRDAKNGGRNRVCLYARNGRTDVPGNAADTGWAQRIRQAIDSGRFALACQPIVHVASGEVSAYEVLLRMLDEDDDLILPNGFLSAAERFGLAVELDKWVIGNSIALLARQRAEQPGLRYSINLSAKTLSDLSVCRFIDDQLRKFELSPNVLTFEVSETAAIADLSLSGRFLRALQELGCTTALDDFGSGMSSFAYLRDLPVDLVKIDGRYIRQLGNSQIDWTLVRATHDICHALGKHTVAEFVENAAILQQIRELAIDFAQGYHLGRPDIIVLSNQILTHSPVAAMCELQDTVETG